MTDSGAWDAKAASLVTVEKLAAALGQKLEPLPIRRALLVDSPRAFTERVKRGGVNTVTCLGLECAVDTRAAVVLVKGLGMGTPAVAMTVEILRAVGVERLVHLGTGARLSTGNQFPIGSVAIVRSSLSSSSLPQHYLSGARPPAAKADRWPMWLEWAKARGFLADSAMAWTTDAPFRETATAVEWAIKHGAALVEMEAAGVLAVAEHFGLEAICLRVISDGLSPQGWQAEFRHAKVREARTRLLELLASGDWP